MARIGFIDDSGYTMPAVWTVMKEGHDVLYYTEKAEYRKIGRGLVARAESIKEIIDWHPDVVIDYNIADAAIRKVKIPVIGSTKASMQLEDDRLFAGQIAQRYKVGEVPKTFRFGDLKRAVAFVDEDKSRSRWVFKAEGHEASTTTTHITEDDEHLLDVLEFEASRGTKSFILQEFIDGLEISIEGWFDHRKGWLQPFNSTLERKRLMASDVGPMTGCMGSVVWAWPGSRPKLFRQTLEGLTDYLKKIEYVGPIDGNFIISYKSRQPYFLEFTPRLGWNAFVALMAGMSGVGEFLVKLARGETDKMSLTSSFMVAVDVYAPTDADIPVRAPLDDWRIFPEGVWHDGKTLRSVGCEDSPIGMTPILGVATTGSTIGKATEEIYEEVIPRIHSTDLSYRCDIGEKAGRDIELLESWGYVVSKESKPRPSAYSVPTAPTP